MPTIESSVIIKAPIKKVMELAQRVEEFPEFMEDVEKVEILHREDQKVISRWSAKLPEFHLTIHWTEEDCWDLSARTCRFRQIEGDYRKFEGVWTFSEVPEGTLFLSTVEIEYDVPLIGSLLRGLIAKKAKENLDATLLAIKRKAEEQIE